MATWIWILIIIAALIIIGLVAARAASQRRSTMLRQRFGDEYDRTLHEHDDRRAAEAELIDRQRRRAQLDIRPLPEADRARFAQEWHEVQERFVDEPSNAVTTAHTLVAQAMRARGYPVDNFESQSDLLSVDHPQLVADYRLAHSIYERNQTQQASTEDLREAMLRYRSLFDELLEVSGTGTTTGNAGTGTTTGNAGTGTTTGNAGTADTAGAPAGTPDPGAGPRAETVGNPPETNGQGTDSEYNTMRRGGR